MEDVTSVSLGVRHTAAIKTDGSLWIWGMDRGIAFGRDHGTPFHHMPTQIMDNVTAVSAGGISFGLGPITQHTLALRADGSLWSWGTNEFGQLGDGTTTERNEPMKIMENVMLPGGVPPTLLPDVSNSPDTPTLRFTVGITDFFHNGTPQQAEAAPFISQSRAMIPLRIIAEALGAEVGWHDVTRTITITGREETISLVVGDPLPDNMGTPIIVNGLTFVPARYVTETLGASVRWDEENNAVYVS